MVTCLDDKMGNTHNRRAGAENAQGNENLPPPPSLAHAIASLLESRDEQTELLCQLMANPARGGNGARNVPALAPTTYSDFATTHPPLFTKAGEPLEADHWLRVMESKFGLLHCTEVQKTLFVAQQLRGDVPRVYGPKAGRRVHARLLQAVQPPGTICDGPSGHRREEAGPLHDRSLHQATGVHGAQHRRDISRVCQQYHDRR
jgi:hypothetical protein